MNTDRLYVGLAVVVALAAYTVIAFSFFASDPGETQLVYLALLGAPLGMAMVMMPQFALILLGALVYSIDWLSEYWSLVPREATWLIDILLLLLVARTLLFMPVRREKMPAVEKLAYVILAFALFSALINRSSTVTTLVGLRVGFRYVMLFVAAYHLNVSRRWLRGYILYLFLIGLIQTPIIIAQFQYLGWSDPDTLCGTFGHSQTPGVAIFLIILICFLVSRAIEDRRLRTTDIALVAFMSISPVLGEAKFFFLFLPILIMYMIRYELFKRPFTSIALVVFGFAMIWAVDYVILATGGWQAGRNPLTYVTRLYDVWVTETEEPQTERYERGYRFVSSIKLAAESPRTAILGNGPGSVTLSYVSESHSTKAAYYSRFGLTSTAQSIAWMLTEYGFLGTALFGLILWMIYRRGLILRKSHDRELRIYGRTLEGMTFIYVAWLLYVSAWQSDSMNFIYWPLAGMFVYFSYQEEASQKQAAFEARRQSLKAVPAAPGLDPQTA